MSEKKQTENKQYTEAREAFDALKIEEKAVFLIESTVSAMARGLEDAGKALGQALESMFNMPEQAEEEEVAEEEVAEKPAAKKPAPKKTTRRKTTPRRTTKRTTKKAEPKDEEGDA